MDERPDQPPEGKLIADALNLQGMSIRKAARLAGISYGRWRQITTGYQNVSQGSYARVHAPAVTLARMAVTVGVSPVQLEAAGRADAADALRNLPASQPRRQYDDDALQAIWELPGLDADVKRGMIALAIGMREQEAREEAAREDGEDENGRGA
jgi:hypothetical protein